MILRYVPPIKVKHKAVLFVSFFIVALAMYYLYERYGIAVILIFTFIYSITLLFSFISLSNKHYIKLDEEKNTVEIHKFFSKHTINITDIKSIELVETKKSYILLIILTDHQREFALSGSLSFEEPPFLPFLRKIHQIKPEVGFGEYCLKVLKGESSFNPWSPKMYYTYWTYIGIMVSYYIFLLLFINIFK